MRIELRLLGQMLVLGIITDQKEGFTLLHTTLCKIVENDKVCVEVNSAPLQFTINQSPRR